MPASEDSKAWERLGQMLVRRRVELDPRYARSLQVFADERHINYRLAWDIEGARRVNYTRASLALVELAYGLEHGSVEEALAGGSFRLSEMPASRDRATDPSYRAILDAEGLTEGEKLDAIAAIEDRRRRLAEAGFTERQQEALRRAPGAYKTLMDRKREQDEPDGESDGRSA